jgi:hypothetical protein
MLDDHIRALGYAEAEPVFFHHAIIEVHSLSFHFISG